MPATRLPDTRRASSPSIWRDRAFRLIWAGQTASLFGDQVTGLALPWLILLQTHSALAAGLVASARYVPLLALGLLAGMLADRVDRRVLMIASDAGRGLALGAVALLGVLRQSPALWLLALVVLVLGTGQLFFQVAYQAWLPDMTGDEQLSRANAALEASDAISVLAGYPLAGALISVIGPVLALGADALSFVVSALTLSQVRPVRPAWPEPPENMAARSGGRRMRLRDAWAEASAGVRAILSMPEQRLLKGVGTALYLNVGAIVVLVATLTQLRLHLPAWQAGLVFGAMGAGGLIGSALAPRIYDWDWRRGLAGALGVVALGCLGLAWACVLDPAGGFAVALVADLLMDGAAALGFILIGTATALVTPRDLRGRVNAASAIYSSAVRGVAAIGGGALAATGNPLSAFLLLAGCCGCAALVAARSREQRAE
jgi:MFS family permease